MVKDVAVALGLLLLVGACVGQEAPASAAPALTPIAALASAPTRGGSPTPYSAPISVPSAAGQFQPSRITAPQVSVTPAPGATFGASCDSTGCWGADGTRYNAVGGSLLRPDGRMCQNVGGVMQCP